MDAYGGPNSFWRPLFRDQVIPLLDTVRMSSGRVNLRYSLLFLNSKHLIAPNRISRLPILRVQASSSIPRLGFFSSTNSLKQMIDEVHLEYVLRAQGISG